MLFGSCPGASRGARFAYPAWLGMIFSAGLDSITGVGFGTTQQLAILGGVSVVFLPCALTPLESGVRYVSDANMLLAGTLLLFVFFAGPLISLPPR